MCFGGHSGMVLTGDPWDQGLTPERAPQSLSFVNTRIAQPCFRIVSRCFFTRGKSSRKNRSRGGGSKEPPDKMLERRLLPEPLWAKWHLHRKCLLLRTSTHPTTSSEWSPSEECKACWEPRNPRIWTWRFSSHLSSETGRGCTLPWFARQNDCQKPNLSLSNYPSDILNLT